MGGADVNGGRRTTASPRSVPSNLGESFLAQALLARQSGGAGARGCIARVQFRRYRFLGNVLLLQTPPRCRYQCRGRRRSRFIGGSPCAPGPVQTAVAVFGREEQNGRYVVVPF